MARCQRTASVAAVRSERKYYARGQDLERVMLQFGTHFCMHQFFAFAASHCLRQTSWHDFFCAKAGADTNGKPSAATTATIFSMLFPPERNDD